jgi:recombinational DNA repair ATPase RecF
MRAQVEYKKFLQKNLEQFSDHEKRIAKIILENFSQIAETTSARGQRGKSLVTLISKHREISSDLKDLINDSSQNESFPITKLTKIDIQNFRGFSDKQSLEFKTPYTFVYGPNGTGKSSLCEALEYCLIGSINEADAKRIPIAEYIKNAITGKAVEPTLLAEDHKGTVIQVHPNPQFYEFCFIEKNRIDGFARVSANTPNAQQVRLAALFGLEEFNSFVNNFNESLATYLDCEGILAKQLADKEKQIAAQKLFESSTKEREQIIATQRNSILQKFPQLTSIEEISNHLNGTDSTQGLISHSNEKLVKLGLKKKKDDPGITDLGKIATEILLLLKERSTLTETVEKYKNQLNLRDLYTAIQLTQETTPDHCPACQSNIYVNGQLALPRDPYIAAGQELKKFDLAIQQEKRLAEVKDLLKEKWGLLKTKIIQLTEFATLFDADIPAWEELQAETTKSKTVEEIESLILTIQKKSNLTTNLTTHLNQHNKSVSEAESEIKQTQAQIKVLETISKDILLFNNKISEETRNLQNAKTLIAKFVTENEGLIAQVAKEKILVESNKLYLSAYLKFREKLEHYNTSLPSSLSRDINSKALEIYNAINKHDHHDDQLSGLDLPTGPGKKINITFKSGQKADALQILSEGHIRCLGLSILLAKNINEKLPILIFDDVVNSIDDEHRQGVIDAILHNDEINKNQLIITTHGEEFVKRLENSIKKDDYQKMVTRIDFLVPENSKKIFIKLDSARNYLVVADQHLTNGALRDGLSYGRKAFEDLLNRLWKHLLKKSYSVQIEVAVRGPNGIPDLMAVANGLKKFLSKQATSEKQEALPLLEEMIGNDKKYPLEWAYLNKGTHEEDRSEEFDRVSVKELLNLLGKMDKTI